MAIGPIALSAFMAFGQGADLWSTERVLARCSACYEANPLMGRQDVRLTTKAILVTGASVTVFKLWPKHRKTAIAIAVIGGGLGIAAALHNERLR